MIYSKKWMVVPYESDEDEKIVPDFKNKLNDHKLSDYDRVKQYQDEKTKIEQKTIQIKKQELENGNNNNIIKTEPLETIAEKTGKEAKSLKNTVVPDYHKEELNKLSESYIKRAPAKNTRQSLKRLQGEKRKLQRSILFNESRVLNSNKSKSDQTMIKKRPKIIQSKKNKPKTYRYARLENDDIEMMDDSYITDESSETEPEPKNLYKGKKNVDFGNISAINSK